MLSIGSSSCVPMAFTAESPPAQGQYSPQGSSSNNGCCCLYRSPRRYDVGMLKYPRRRMPLVRTLISVYCCTVIYGTALVVASRVALHNLPHSLRYSSVCLVCTVDPVSQIPQFSFCSVQVQGCRDNVFECCIICFVTTGSSSIDDSQERNLYMYGHHI